MLFYLMKEQPKGSITSVSFICMTISSICQLFKKPSEAHCFNFATIRALESPKPNTAQIGISLFLLCDTPVNMEHSGYLECISLRTATLLLISAFLLPFCSFSSSSFSLFLLCSLFLSLLNSNSIVFHNPLQLQLKTIGIEDVGLNLKYS